MWNVSIFFFFVFFCLQAEDGMRKLVRCRGLGGVYKRQEIVEAMTKQAAAAAYVHAIMFTSEPLETYAAELALSLIHI